MRVVTAIFFSRLILNANMINFQETSVDEKEFNALDYSVQMSLLFAMYIRNSMENFHCRHLSDDQMKQLNPIIRQAFYNMFRYLEISMKAKDQNEKHYAKSEIHYQISLIPHDWEHPTEEEFQKELAKGISIIKEFN